VNGMTVLITTHDMEEAEALCDELAILHTGRVAVVAQLNPLTYLVDALRGLMIVGGESVHGYGVDFAGLIAAFVVLLMVAVRLYPTLVE
jgi:ABC-type uncharacterized transport system ATPase subunit